MKRILTLCSIIMMAMNTNALSEWPRKYATTVVRGHVTRYSKAPAYSITTYARPSDGKNIKGETTSHCSIDSTGIFCLKWNMCWPVNQTFKVCGINLDLLLFPGDTLDIEIDYQKAIELKDDIKKLYQKAIKIHGASFRLSPQYMGLKQKLLSDYNAFNIDSLNKYCRVNFDAYREMEWGKYLKKLKEVKTSKLKKQEKEILQMRIEEKYISNFYSFNFLMQVIGCDSTEMAAAKQQFTAVDPHAHLLMSPKSIANVYYLGTGHLDYLKANGLDNLPLGQYLKERKKAEEVVSRLKAFRPVSPDEIDGLSPEFRQPLHELKAEIADKAQPDTDWQPTGKPDTWLQQIVARHKGHIVFVDYWATWCGPCNKGIQEIATVKDKYEKLGVDFVYITDSSSSTNGFLNLKKKHPGDHFLFTKEETQQMNIPEFSGSIPYYLIYGRDGKLIKTISGWPGLENITKELNKVLTK